LSEAWRRIKATSKFFPPMRYDSTVSDPTPTPVAVPRHFALSIPTVSYSTCKNVAETDLGNGGCLPWVRQRLARWAVFAVAVLRAGLRSKSMPCRYVAILSLTSAMLCATANKSGRRKDTREGPDLEEQLRICRGFQGQDHSAQAILRASQQQRDQGA